MKQQVNDTSTNHHSIECPSSESYRSNSEKEILILRYVENFRRQYHYIYGDRKGLLLNPLNECGMPVGKHHSVISILQKFVCTTLRPTMLPYSELTEWNWAADFLADHLNYDLLEPSSELVSDEGNASFATLLSYIAASAPLADENPC